MCIAQTLRHNANEAQKGSGQMSPGVPSPSPQGEFGDDMLSSSSSKGAGLAGLSDFTYLS